MKRIIREHDLRFELFTCCGDEDLYPFICPSCARCMVFCYECGTLYRDVSNLSRRGSEDVNHFEPKSPAFSCDCGFAFEYRFMRNRMYRPSEEQWVAGGGRPLLKETVGS
jgi:hypothetical protein